MHTHAYTGTHTQRHTCPTCARCADKPQHAPLAIVLNYYVTFCNYLLWPYYLYSHFILSPSLSISLQFVDIGVVTSIESNHKNIEFARKGQEICIKIEPIPGESPKMFGRHFEADDFLVSKVSSLLIDKVLSSFPAAQHIIFYSMNTQQSYPQLYCRRLVFFRFYTR